MNGEPRSGKPWVNVPGMLSYLDAGTGQMIVAALAGGVAGVGVLFKMYWHRVLGVFSRKHRETAEQAQLDLLGVDAEDETASATSSSSSS